MEKQSVILVAYIQWKKMANFKAQYLELLQVDFHNSLKAIEMECFCVYF